MAGPFSQSIASLISCSVVWYLLMITPWRLKNLFKDLRRRLDLNPCWLRCWERRLKSINKQAYLTSWDVYVCENVAVYMWKFHDSERKVISFIVDAWQLVIYRAKVSEKQRLSNKSSYNVTLNHLRNQDRPWWKCLQRREVGRTGAEEGFQSLQTKNESNKGTS